MTENYRKVTKKAHARNRNVRRQARKKVENRLTAKYGSRAKAKEVMKGKDVHKTNRGLELIGHSDHGKKHGRGNRGKPRVYRNK